MPAVTPPTKRPRILIEIIKAAGEVLGDFADAADRYIQNPPEVVGQVVGGLLLLMAHIDIVAAVAAQTRCVVVRGVAGGWHRLVRALRGIPCRWRARRGRRGR